MTRLTARSADVKMPLSFGTTHHRSAALSVLALAMALSMTLPANAQAQNPAGANATKYNIAVVDISYVFKNHRRFKAAMEAMKKEMEGIEGELKGDREKIAQARTRAQYIRRRYCRVQATRRRGRSPNGRVQPEDGQAPQRLPRTRS